MRARCRTIASWILVAAGLAMSGCASTGAPQGWLPVAKKAPQDPYGAWIRVELVEMSDQEGFGAGQDDLVAGEFLAVDSDMLYVLAGTGSTAGRMIAIPLPLIRKARVAQFDPETGTAVGWVVVGSLSTVSHGLGAAISLPLWIIIGSSMAGSHSYAPLEDFPKHTWVDLRKYARFPQGPPPGMGEMGLQPRPDADPGDRH